MKKQIVVNIFSNYAGHGVGMLLGFFLIPFLVAKLGVELFGLIVLFESLMQLVEVASTSVRVALSRYATFSLAEGKTAEFVSYLSTGRRMLFGLSGLVLAAGLGFAYVLPGVLNMPADTLDQSRILFSTMIIAFVITIPNIVFWSGLYAKQRFDLINLSTSAALILRACAVFIAFSLLPDRHVSLASYGVIYLLVTWAQNMFIYLCYKKVLPGLAIRMRSFDATKMKAIFTFSVYTLISHISIVAHDNALSIMINLLWGPAYNALYAIGIKFANVMDRLFSEPAWALTPAFTDLVAKGEKEKLKELLLIFTKAMTVVTVPLCLVLMVFADQIMLKWVGPQFTEAVFLMRVSLVPLFVALPISACANFPNAYAQVKLPSVVNSVYSVVSVLLCYVMGSTMDLGLRGVVIATSGLSFLYSLVYMPTYACRIAGFSLREFWARGYFGAFVWAAVVWGAGLGTLRFYEKNIFSLESLAAVVALTVAYSSGCYLWVMTSRDRGHLHELLQSFNVKVDLASS